VLPVQRPQQPITGAGLAQRLGARIQARQPAATHAHATVFVVDGCRSLPGGGIRCGNRGGMDPRFHAGDQVVLPAQALGLPATARRTVAIGPCGRRAAASGRLFMAVDSGTVVHVASVTAAARSQRQGMTRASWVEMCGIMLAFMWCITHSEPASTMTTRTTVN